MKTLAAVLYEMGQSRPYADSQPLKIEEVDLLPPGTGEVLVQVEAAGLCHSDLSVIDGSRPRVMPMVLGHEASGIVRELGAGVRDLKEGDRVVFSFVPVCGQCTMCAGGRGWLCENGAKANVAGTLLSSERRFRGAESRPLNHHLGVSAFSQFTVAAEQSLVKIDPSVPSDKAALFGCAVMTGVGAVLNTARIEPGASVAVFGLGGVGLSAVLGARLAAADPIIAVDVVPAKLELARRAGATHTINASQVDPVAAIKDLSRGGVAYAIDCVGGSKVLEQAFQSTGRGGATVTIGLPDPSQRLSISPVTIVGEERRIYGSYMGSCVPRRDIPRFVSLYRSGRLPVDLLHSHTIELQNINAAFDTLAAGQAVRQLVSFDKC